MCMRCVNDWKRPLKILKLTICGASYYLSTESSIYCSRQNTSTLTLDQGPISFNANALCCPDMCQQSTWSRLILKPSVLNWQRHLCCAVRCFSREQAGLWRWRIASGVSTCYRISLSGSICKWSHSVNHWDKWIQYLFHKERDIFSYVPENLL